MFDRTSPRYWLLRFGLGLFLLVAAGLGVVPRLLRVGDPLGLMTLLVGLIGFRMAFHAAGPLVRVMGADRRLRDQWSEAARQEFARASLPRRVHRLLTAVAEADGAISEPERATVRHFLLERFGGPVSAAEVQQWEASPLSIGDRRGLAARIAMGLDDTERDSLFCWCCLVGFADRRFAGPTHAALQDVATGLGIPPPRARMLFHLARAQFLAGDPRGERGDSTGERRGPARAGDARRQALETLGLAADATQEQIRKRHRELVRRFHPDAQPNLGPVAQREATERFTAIQRAYETLTG
ncbi:MAG: DnaJ domain-containing protein [Planctomycetota bacterium]